MGTVFNRRVVSVVLLLLLHATVQCHSGKHSKASRARQKASMNDRERDACPHIKFLLGSVSCSGFLAEYWEKKPLLSTGTATSATKTLFSGADLPTLLQMWDMKVNGEHGQVIFIRPNTFQHDQKFAQGDPVTFKMMKQALEAGIFSEKLSDFTNLYVQINMYFSPPQVPVSVSLHQDAQSVFIIQLEGEKKWNLYAPKQSLALKPQIRGKAGDVVQRSEVGEHLLEAVLSPGDVLFIPRGVFHATSTESTSVPSLHLTVGMETDSDELTWGHWLSDAIGMLSSEVPMWQEDSYLREALPLRMLRQEKSPSLSARQKTRAVQFIHRMLETLQDADDSVWDTVLRKGLSKRRDHLAAKRQQLLRFRQAIDSP